MGLFGNGLDGFKGEVSRQEGSSLNQVEFFRASEPCGIIYW